MFSTILKIQVEDNTHTANPHPLTGVETSAVDWKTRALSTMLWTLDVIL